VICHNETREKQNWIKVKAKVISRFGTVKAAASQIGCHPNAIRYAAANKCPKVKAKLQQHIKGI
jgi:hypothetical protein